MVQAEAKRAAVVVIRHFLNLVNSQLLEQCGHGGVEERKALDELWKAYNHTKQAQTALREWIIATE